MVKKYDFKRDIYYKTLDTLREYPVVFLYGSRNTGKTVCLKQLAAELPGAEYHNIQAMENSDAYYLGSEIENCLKSNEPRIILIDNPGYFKPNSSVFEGIGRAFWELDEGACRNTRLVFAGGSPQAMRRWADKHFGDMAAHVVSDFPSYSEWFRFYGESGDFDSPENRERFMFEKSGLNGNFVSFDGFLKGCLAEAEVVDFNAASIVYEHFFDINDDYILKTILYAVLERELAGLKANAVVLRYLNTFSVMSPDTLEQGYCFLRQYRLITSPAEHFDPASARISHPFVRAELLKEAFGGEIPPEIKRAAASLCL